MMFGRYRGLFLPARQGLLGADDARGRVAHPRDGKEAVEEEELASPPGGREHGRAPAEGRSRGTALPAAEPPPELQRVGSAAGTGGRQGRGRALDASVELAAARNRGCTQTSASHNILMQLVHVPPVSKIKVEILNNKKKFYKKERTVFFKNVNIKKGSKNILD